MSKLIEKFEMIRTCHACPEQYDILINGQLAGYLRLRHGYFCATSPDVDGVVVYEAYPEGDGLFEETERGQHLANAQKAVIDYWWKKTEER